MMQVIPKWRVVVMFDAGDNLVLFLHDHHASNILRKLAEITFPIPVTGYEIVLEAE